MARADWWTRRGRRVEAGPVDVGPRSVPATVQGVYGTAHTSWGDVETGPPESMSVDCELTTYLLPIERCEDGEITSVTLHLGVVNVEVPVTPPCRTRKGDRATVVMPVGMTAMSPAGPLPGWARRG